MLTDVVSFQQRQPKVSSVDPKRGWHLISWDHLWSNPGLSMGENSACGQALTRDRDSLWWAVLPARDGMLRDAQGHAAGSSPLFWVGVSQLSLPRSIREHTLTPQSCLGALYQAP